MSWLVGQLWLVVRQLGPLTLGRGRNARRQEHFLGFKGNIIAMRMFDTRGDDSWILDRG